MTDLDAIKNIGLERLIDALWKEKPISEFDVTFPTIFGISRADWVAYAQRIDMAMKDGIAAAIMETAKAQGMERAAQIADEHANGYRHRDKPNASAAGIDERMCSAAEAIARSIRTAKATELQRDLRTATIRGDAT